MVDFFFFFRFWEQHIFFADNYKVFPHFDNVVVNQVSSVNKIFDCYSFLRKKHVHKLEVCVCVFPFNVSL